MSSFSRSPVTLQSVQHHFNQWRRDRSSRGRTPPELQRQAVALLSTHCPSHICAALKIHDRALKRWAQSAQSTALRPTAVKAEAVGAPFIELPSASSPVGVIPVVPTAKTVNLGIELDNGILLSINAQLTLEQILQAASAVTSQGATA